MKKLKIVLAFSIGILIAGCHSGSTIDSAFLGGVTLSTARSTITVSALTVTAGASLAVTLTARDQSGNLFYVPGSNPTVTFQTAGGTSTGQFSAVVNHQDGTYTTTFTGVDAGTPTTLTASLNGMTFGPSPAVSVISGSYSLSNSYVTLANSTVASGQSILVTLHSFDDSNNPLTSGGLTVAFTKTGGTGTFSAVTDNNDGTYSATFTGGTAGTVSISATIAGTAISSAAPSLTVTPGAPASIAVASGNNQSGTVGLGLTNPLVAVVKDAAGNLVPNVSVNWSATSGNLSSTTVSTNSNGLSSNTLTLSSTAGSTTVTGTVVATALSTTFTETGLASSSIGSIVWSTAPSLSYTASNSSPMTTFTAKLLDTNGNLIASNSTTTVTLSLAQGTGSLSGTLTETAANGVVTFNNVNYTKAESIVITATETTASHTVTSGTIVVSPNSPSSSTSTIQAGASSVSSDGVTPVTITITLKDAYGNVVPNYAAPHFSSTGSGNNLTQPSTATNSLGQSAGSMTSTVAETKTLSISLPSGFTSDTTTVTFAATAVVAANSSISGTGPVVANGSATSAITITLLDINSNPVSGVTPSFSATGSNNSYGSCSASNASGVSTCTMTSTTAETKTLSITGPVSKSGGTVLFTSGPASQLVWTTQPSGGTAGVAWATQGVVTIEDANGNVITTGVDSTATVTLTLQTGSGSLNGTTSVVAAGGVANFAGANLTITSAGAKTIRATKASTLGSGGTAAIYADSNGITISSSTAILFSVTGFTNSTVAGAAHSLTVTALDTYGNQASTYSGTIHFTSNDSAATLPSDYTFTTGSGQDNGSHIFSGVILKTSGTQSITATDTATSTLTGSESSIVVSPASASTLTVTGIASSITAGSSNSMTVTAIDPYGNTATGYTGTVAFSTTSTLSVLPSNYTFTSGSGLDNGFHTFSGVILKTSGTQSITATDTATSSLTGSESSIAVSPSSATTLTVTGIASSITAGSANSVTVTALDTYGNQASGYTGTVAFTTTSMLKTLPSNYTFTSGTGLDNGTHTFTSGVSLNTAGTQSVTATDTVTNTITGTESSITVNAATADHLIKVAGDTQTQTAGSQLSINPKAQVVDSYGNAVQGTSLTFTPSAGSVGASLVTTDSSGNAQTTWTLGTTAGAQTLTVARQTTALPGTPATLTFNETASVGLASSSTSTIQVSSPTIVADGNTSVTVTITLLDQYSNPVSGSTASFASTGSGNVLTQPSGTTNASGVITGSIKTTVAEIKTLSISSPSGLTTDTATLTAASPTLSIAAASANEGSNLSFVVTLSSASTQSVTVHYASSDGTAVSGTNYTSTSGTLTIAAGQTTGTITVPTIDDTVYNVALNMTMTLSSPTNATIQTASATGTINNIDSQPSILINDPTVNEGSAESFTISLSNASYQSISVAYATSNGTALAGTNYTAKSGTLTIPAGSTSGTVSVTTIDDGVYSTTGLTFNLNLSSPTNATIADNIGIGTINNIDSAPTVQFTASTQSVNQSPSTQTVTVTAQLSTAENTNTTTTIPLTLSGTAVSGTDYTISPASITIAGGATTGTTTLTITNSGTPGVDKTAILTMGTPTNATLGSTTSQTVTIVNNNYPTVSYSVATQDVAINQGTATVTVTLSTAPTKTVTVPIVIDASSTAISGTDYSLTVPTLTFTSGVTSQSFTVTILDQSSPATSNATIVFDLGSLTDGTAGSTPNQTITIREPSLDLNFAAMYNPSTQMSQSPYSAITFTRASTATYIDCDGVMKTAAINVPRIDCNPTTGQPNGILIEESRINSIIYTTLIGTSIGGWGGLSSSMTANTNYTTAPDGTSSASLLTKTGTTANGQTYGCAGGVSNASTWTGSVYIAKDTNESRYPAMELHFGNGTTNLWYQVFLDTKTGAVTPAGSATSSTVGSQSVGSYWRVWATGTNNSTGNTGLCLGIYPAGGTTAGTFSNAATGSVTAWGAQLEQGAFPTSFIPTTTSSSVTRSADYTSVNNISWYNASYGTFLSQFFSDATGGDSFMMVNSCSPTCSFLRSNFSTTSNYSAIQDFVSSSYVFSDWLTGYTASTTDRISFSYNTNNFVGTLNGANTSTISSGAVPTVTTLNFGQGTSGPAGRQAIPRFTYYQQLLSSSVQQYLTNQSNSFRTYTPTANLSLTSQTVIEPQGTVYVTAALSEPAQSTITVPYTVGGTAVSGTNYSGLSSGNFTFTAGQSRSTISFTLKDDGTSTNPTITVTLSSGTGYSLGSNTTQTITIQRPTLDLNFAAMYNPATQISQSPYSAVTFTRSSTASYMDATGLIAYAAVNVPRIDYNPTTHQPNGLLIEESRTNSLIQSQNFNSNFSHNNVTVASSGITTPLAPDGTSTANLITESTDGSNVAHYMVQNVTATVAQSWTLSFYVYPGSRSQVQVLIMDNGATGNYVSANYTLSGNGTASSATNTGNGSGVSASIQALSSGWYRCVLSGTPDTSGTTVRSQITLLSGGSTVYQGNGSGAIYLWGAQLEAGAFPTSYIPTTSAAVTRSADSAYTGTSWLNSSQGSFYYNGYVGDTSGFVNARFLAFNIAQEPLSVNISSLTGLQTYDGTENANSTVASINSMFKEITVYSGSTQMMTASGITYSSVAFAGWGTPTKLSFSGYGGATFVQSYLKEVAYWPVALSNAATNIISGSLSKPLRTYTPTVTLRTASQSVLQSDGQAFFVAVLSQPAASTITVPYTISGTATSGTDYSGLSSGTLTFAAGSSIATTSFTVLTTASTGKTVIMTLGSPTGATLGTYSSETIYLTNSTNGLALTSSTIINDNSTVTFSGTCGASETITISGTQSGTTTCSTSGTWSWTSSTISTDGSYTFNFTESDGINSSTAVTGTYDRDTTAPTAVSNFLDGNTTTSLTTSPTMTWTATTDPTTNGYASGVSYYMLAIGSTAGGSDIVSWTNVGNVTTYQFTSLNLTNGTMYYGSIKAVDNAGNISSVTQGDGFAVVTDTPTLAFNFINSTTISAGTALTSTNTTYPTMIQFSNASGSSIAAPMYYNSAGTLTAAAENLLSYSTNFTNWTNNGSATLNHDTTAPDGSTAYSIAASSYFVGVYTSFSAAASTAYTLSVYVKNVSGGSLVEVGSDSSCWGSGSQTALLNINTITGAISNVSSGITSYSSASLPNSWWRVELSATTASTCSPSFVLYNANSTTSENAFWGAQAESGINATNIIYTNGAKTYGPRFDYNPTSCTGGVCTVNGWLIEETRTNYLLYSQDLTQSQWSSSDLTPTKNLSSPVAPDGTQTSNLLTEGNDGSTAATHKIQQEVSGLPVNNAYGLSVYVQPAGRTQVQISLTDSSASTSLTSAVFTLSGAGSISNLTSTGSSNSGYANIQALSNGWYRCNLRGYPDSTGTSYYWAITLMNGGATSYIGNGSSGVYVWGTQMEKGWNVTSYIPTGSTSMSRSADTASIQNNLSWFNSNAGTFVSSAISSMLDDTAALGLQAAVMSFESLYNTRITLSRRAGASSGPGYPEAQYISAGTNYLAAYASGSINWSEQTAASIAIAYQSADFSAMDNASSLGTSSTAGALISPTTLYFGTSQAFGVGNWDGWIQSVNYYNTRLTNSAIQELTHP